MSVEMSGKRNAYYTADLVVALEHLPLVTSMLADRKVPLRRVEHSDELGLALMSLENIKTAAKRLSEGTRQPRTTKGDTKVDQVLALLRQRFADDYAGWVPTLGKNRLLGHVVGGGKVSHGGDTPPKPTPDRLDARKADPGQGVKVGVLDTAIANHPWLAGAWTAAPDSILSGASHSMPSVAGHATFVAGVVIEQAPGCTVEVRRVLDQDGEATSWDVAKAIAAFGESQLDILNLSFCCYTEDGQPPLVLSAAVEALDRDVVVVAAAGNHGATTTRKEPDAGRKPTWPAALDHVVAVGAAACDGTPAPFTPKDAPWIDVYAPGINVLSTFPDVCAPLTQQGTPAKPNPQQSQNGYVRWSGSSFSAAFVTGLIAGRTIPDHVSSRQAWTELRERAGERPGFLGRH